MNRGIAPSALFGRFAAQGECVPMDVLLHFAQMAVHGPACALGYRRSIQGRSNRRLSAGHGLLGLSTAHFSR